MGIERFQSEICILLNRACRWMKATCIIFRVSITSQIHRQTTVSWHLLGLKLRKMGRKLNQSLEVPILTRELYVFTRTDLCFSTRVSASRLDYEQSLCFLIVRRERSEKKGCAKAGVKAKGKKKGTTDKASAFDLFFAFRLDTSFCVANFREAFFSLHSRRTIRKQRDCS